MVFLSAELKEGDEADKQMIKTLRTELALKTEKIEMLMQQMSLIDNNQTEAEVEELQNDLRLKCEEAAATCKKLEMSEACLAELEKKHKSVVENFDMERAHLEVKIDSLRQDVRIKDARLVEVELALAGRANNDELVYELKRKTVDQGAVLNAKDIDIERRDDIIRDHRQQLESKDSNPLNSEKDEVNP